MAIKTKEKLRNKLALLKHKGVENRSPEENAEIGDIKRMLAELEQTQIELEKSTLLKQAEDSVLAYSLKNTGLLPKL